MGTGPAIFDGTGADGADWGAGDNWTGGTGALGVPAAGDDVYVKAIKKDVVTNLATFSAINIASLQVSSECSKNLGSLAASVEFGNITSVVYGGSGDFCKLKTNGTVTLAAINPARGTFVAVGGTWTEIDAGGFGKLSIDSSAIVAACKSTIEMEDALNGTGYTLLEIGAGVTARIYRNFATAHTDGFLITGGSAAITTTCIIGAMGTLNHQSSGTITHYENKTGGRFTVRGNPNLSFTITNHTLWQGSIVEDQAPGLSVTKTNAAKFVGSWGAIGIPISRP